MDSKEIAGETIRRELAEREVVNIQPDIDDTDGLDPSAEFDLWRARELARLLRDKQAQAERDEEKEEIERRRALPEEQRLREDMEYADATRQREKGEMGFLQKYYHKGAFHQVCMISRSGRSILKGNRMYRTTICSIETILLPRRAQWT